MVESRQFPVLPDGTINLGTARYIFSNSTREYLKPLATSSYPANKSIVIINEPHFNSDAQFNLYKGLESFFTDNPTSLRNTVFLAEALPVGENLSLAPLIESEPFPQTALIRESLRSFLITGYSAYEWKYKHGIPIMGTEDKHLYALCREYRLILDNDPDRLFTTVQHGNNTITISLESAWNFLVTARNKAIAHAVYTASQQYDHTVLFVGGLHMGSMTDTHIFDYLKYISIKDGSNTPFDGFALPERQTATNAGLIDYLVSLGIGITFLSPKGMETYTESDQEIYKKVFQTQSHSQFRHVTPDYHTYADWFLQHAYRNQRIRSKDIYFSSTTVESNPDAASVWLKKRTDVIYDREDAYYMNWFTIPSQEVQEYIGRKSLWSNPSVTRRGIDYENLRKVNLGANYPVVDDIRVYDKVATSMKTINLTDKTYQNPTNIKSLGIRYVDMFDRFPGVTYPDGYHIPREAFEHYHLEIGIPAGKRSDGQRDALFDIQEYGQQKGVRVIIVEVA